MREWFKAWEHQDHSTRDYRKYFKPVLCYLEGAWTHANQDSIEEPFKSDRHFLDARSFVELQDKVRFNGRTGHKSNEENFAVLPTAVLAVNESGPVLGQWLYRILCHPLKKDLPLSMFRMVDDLQSRVREQPAMSLEELRSNRKARFVLNTENSKTWSEGSSRPYRLLDELMYEISGLDGYSGSMRDEVYDSQAQQKDGSMLNAAFYHHWYKVEKKGANGMLIRSRGKTDPNIYMAMNSRPEVVAMETESCPKDHACQMYSQKWSYAIPLEIVFTTPLSNWNPHGVAYCGKAGRGEGNSIYLGEDGKSTRDGECTEERAYNGTNSKVYYRTPLPFFQDEKDVDSADTTKSKVCVLDDRGRPVPVRASGHRMFLPGIEGLGIIRQRYPIAPVSVEGETSWKELEALKDVVLYPDSYKPISVSYPDQVYYSGANQPPSTAPHMDNLRRLESMLAVKEYPEEVVFETQPSDPVRGVLPHRHTITLLAKDWPALVAGEKVEKTTSTVDHHHHVMAVVRLEREREDGHIDYVYRSAACDGNKKGCADGHGQKLFLLKVV